MAHPEIEAWLNTAEGRAMNPDGRYGLQCVDLVDQYGQDNFGVPWSQCVGSVAGARQLLDAAPDAYWIRTDNNPNNPNQIPNRGDVLVFSGSAINQWGHTAVCIEANTSGMWVMQQDGFAAPLVWADGNWYSNKPAHKAWLGYTSNGTGPLAGWLTPRTEKLLITLPQASKPAPAPTQSVESNQRVTGPTGVKRRKEAKIADDNVMDTFDGDLILTLAGYVRGQSVTVNGFTSDIWFMGGLTGGYMWSGAFTDSSTNGLKDLTPAAPAPASSNKRVTGKDGVNRRETADKGGKLVDTFGPDLELTLAGYVIGTDPFGDGNNIWFKGGLTGGYMWSGAFTDKSTNGLKDLTASAPVPIIDVYDFVADFDWVEKIPANLTNVQRAKDNPGIVVFPATPAKDVIHQFGTLGRDTITSTINEFKRAGSLKSAHFVVSGKRCVQMVSLKDRAYHAGTVGNDYVGIETDPLQDADTIATVKRLIADIQKKTGQKVIVLIRHREVPGNNTECGSLIDLNKYQVTVPTNPPVIPPVVVTPPVVTPAPTPTPIPECKPTPESETATLKKFSDWLINQFNNRK